MRSLLTCRQLWGRALSAFALCGFLAAPSFTEEADIDLPVTSAVAVTATESEPTEPAAESTDSSAETETTEDVKESLGRPTHKQVSTIDINSGDLEETSLNSFCLSPSGNILAACGDGPGAIREFTPAGEFVTSWKVDIKPEAINVGSDGNVYIAGQGKLLKVAETGEVLLEQEAPHVAAITASPDKIREEIIEQRKQMREQFGEQIKTYEDMLAPLKEKPEEERTPEEVQQIDTFEQVLTQYKQMSEQYGAEELSEEELDEQVAANIEYKTRIASISEYEGDVFIATGAVEGYGYNVWKLDDDFTGGEVIISDLSGCCGQMDVQCCENGVFVAENSRHRVSRYDTAGEMLTSWGKQAREGLHGFGSCCNPMNVAFGADGSVYTAEDTAGRIKQFTPDGELVALIGKVDVVPGCKKVAIAVAKDGGNVFMLDITKNQIHVMDRLKPGETVVYSESESGGSSFFGSLKDALGL
jgi:hypothetical protein